MQDQNQNNQPQQPGGQMPVTGTTDPMAPVVTDPGQGGTPPQAEPQVPAESGVPQSPVEPTQPTGSESGQPANGDQNPTTGGQMPPAAQPGV